jgi:group I intron endonuclease
MNSGIYFIINIKNGKIYVGSTSNFNTRFYNHKRELRLGIHRNSHLQSAWNKYGEINFAFKIIEKCSYINLVEKEQKWLDIINNLTLTYNHGKLASNPWLGCKHSIESRHKMSKGQLGNKNCVGRILSDETKEKISKGNLNKDFSEEHKNAIRISKLGKSLSENHRLRIMRVLKIAK